MFENVKAFGKLGPLVLSGPPGGFVGRLPQTRVAYDSAELASMGISVSGGNLVDNLNHIRYRITVLEGGGSPGSISIYENDILIASGVTVLNFEGAVSVVDEGGGYVTVTVTSSGVAQSGVMLKSVYDTNDDGIVDSALFATWATLGAVLILELTIFYLDP